MPTKSASAKNVRTECEVRPDLAAANLRAVRKILGSGAVARDQYEKDMSRACHEWRELHGESPYDKCVSGGDLDDSRQCAVLRNGLEDSFAAALPEIMAPRGIRLTSRQVQVRVPWKPNPRYPDDRVPKFDIVARNREVVLVAKVGLEFCGIEKDVRNDVGPVVYDFRRDFPQYEKLRVFGIMAGLDIDDSAAFEAHQRGFFILRMNSDGKIFPMTPRGFRPTAY